MTITGTAAAGRSRPRRQGAQNTGGPGASPSRISRVQPSGGGLWDVCKSGRVGGRDHRSFKGLRGRRVVVGTLQRLGGDGRGIGLGKLSARLEPPSIPHAQGAHRGTSTCTIRSCSLPARGAEGAACGAAQGSADRRACAHPVACAGWAGRGGGAARSAAAGLARRCARRGLRRPSVELN